MKLVYAMLADAAQATPDGKLTVMGGDFDTIFAPSFPAVHDKLALIVKVLLESADLQDQGGLVRRFDSGTPMHELTIECIEPDGDTPVFGGVVQLALEDLPTQSDALPSYRFVVGFPTLVFRVPGTYTLRLRWNGEDVYRTPLFLRQRVPAESRQG